jgi:hypothetical protein
VDLKSIVSARIHPAIGVARVGNSVDECFIGPETLCPTNREPGYYRDKYGRLKRQAARFRIYGYDADGRVVGELTSKNAEICWYVHVANKKAAWYDFDIPMDIPEAANVQSARRNAQFQGEAREQLIIDPGRCEISGECSRSRALEGQFFEEAVYLGELHTDKEGRLLFLGGRGRSGTPFHHCYPPTTFANNPCWFDDTSDGPVSARVSIGGRELQEVESAWVVAVPPNYAPDLIANQNMYDVIFDALTARMLPALDSSFKPSFTQDILPLFRHFEQAQWLNAGFFRLFGAGGLIDFTRPELLDLLSQGPGPDPNDSSKKIDPHKELRLLIFNNFRDPGAEDLQPLKWPPVFGDAYGTAQTPPSPREGLSVTPFLYQSLQQWAKGNFHADYPSQLPQYSSLEELPLADQPAMLDRAALSYCMGGPFHPAFELSWPMRRLSMYKSPFRLRVRPDNFDEPDYGPVLTPAVALSRDGPLSASGPGDITKWLAVPWQTDTASCRAGFQGKEFPNDDFLPAFWVSRVPSQVLTEDNYQKIIDPATPDKDRLAAFRERVDWLRRLKPNSPYVDLITRTVHEFGTLGVIERRTLPEPIPGLPEVMYVESLHGEPLPPSEQKLYPVNVELMEARFNHLKK